MPATQASATLGQSRIDDAAATSPGQSGRLAWLDVAKGVGIMLVVLGHAMTGLIDGMAALPLFVRQLTYVIYTFHMFLFFMLAGALVERRISRDAARFRRSLLTRIAWPYLLWSVVQLTAISLATSLVNNPVGALGPALLALPISPTGQFWFLYSLLIMHILSAALLPRMDPRWLLLLAIGARSLAELPWHAEYVWRTLMFFLPYSIGVAFGPRLDIVGGAGPWKGPAALLLTCTALSLLAIVFRDGAGGMPPGVLAGLSATPIEHLAWSFVAVAAAAAMSFAIIALSHFAGPLTRPLAYVGRQSFAIFVMHILFVAGGRILLAKFLHLTSITLLLPAITVLGIVGPLVAYEVLKRLRVNGWVGLD